MYSFNEYIRKNLSYKKMFWLLWGTNYLYLLEFIVELSNQAYQILPASIVLLFQTNDINFGETYGFIFPFITMHSPPN